jgi:hypothetical protein
MQPRRRGATQGRLKGDGGVRGETAGRPPAYAAQLRRAAAGAAGYSRILCMYVLL